MNAFFQSDWFIWIVVIVVFGGIAYNFIKSAEESGLAFDGIWEFLKKVIMFVLTMVFLPFFIIFGRTKVKSEDKSKKESSG